MKDVMWAPWRGVYVGRPKLDSGCVFCDKLSSKQDRANYVLYRGSYINILMNLYPYNNGHIMLMPGRHIPSIVDLTVDEMNEMGCLLKKSVEILSCVYKCEGFNIGYNIGFAAGAGIAAHLHQHIVPRWQGDTNFMPVIAEAKVIAEHMDTTYDKLYTYFKEVQ